MSPAQTPSQGGHIAYFDLLRLFGALCVVFMHAAAVPLSGSIASSNWRLTVLFTSGAFTAVPLFFLMSGHLLLNSEKTQDIGVLLKTRLPRLLVPLAAWSLLCVLWQSLSGAFSFSGFVQALVACLNAPTMIHLWFMYSAIALYLLSPLLYGAVRGLQPKAARFFLLLLAGIQVLLLLRAFFPAHTWGWFYTDLFDKLQFLDGYLFIFILGYALSRLQRRIPNALLLSVALLDLLCITLGTFWASAKAGSYSAIFQQQNGGLELLLALCLFLLFRQNIHSIGPRLQAALQPFVALSLPIYLMHNLLLAICGHFGLAPVFFPKLCLFVLLIFFACFLFLKTAASIPLLCYPLCGLPYREACKSCNWQHSLAQLRRAKQGAT